MPLKYFSRTALFAIAMAILSAHACRGAILDHVGAKTSWPTSWTPLSNTNDSDDGLASEVDLVGDATDPGGYWAQDGSYVYFRVRVDYDGTVDSGTFRDAHTVLIDLRGYGQEGGLPDFGFSWDSKSNDLTKHGLEMQILGTSSTTWGGVKMDDIDGSPSTKEINDINGFVGTVQRSTDGYVRTVDGQSTASFGSTTFMDFAVSWDYLTAYTPLGPNQTWRVTFGSIVNATDHNAFADISGAALADAPNEGWTGDLATDNTADAVPEPSSLAVLTMVAVAGLGLHLRRRRRNHVCEQASDEAVGEGGQGVNA